MIRHRLDAVYAGAQVDAVEIQLENLILGQLDFEEERNHRFLGLSAERPDVRQKQRPRQLLRQRAAAFCAGTALDVAYERSRDPNWVDAGMGVEAAVLD